MFFFQNYEIEPKTRFSGNNIYFMESGLTIHPIIKRNTMKTTLLSFIAYLIYTNMYAQDKSDLYGRWQLNYTGNNPDLFTLIKVQQEDLDFRWGRFIEFKEDGTYDESASAPCGLDDNQYHYTGTWKYDAHTKTIALTQIKVLNGRPNIYNRYKVLSSGKIQVLDLKTNQAAVKIIQPWEKVSARK